ncbi:hypothetical protein CSKR_101480 [Clonorchis sinensis]|uniref:Uncharacterized protein n=1 Tax=Clonorchis sinensis TaxID=79923 RepID=A0A419PH39_CLOSI|nr:hypothetical protein CSKR_101480 [Clonorchis sinensis]
MFQFLRYPRYHDTCIFVMRYANVFANECISLSLQCKSFGCSLLLVPICHATRRTQEGGDAARLPKPRQGSREAETGFEPRALRSPLVDLVQIEMAQWLEGESTDRKVLVWTRPLPLDFSCLGLDNLAVSKASCFIRVAWQSGTEKVLQLDCFLL